MNVMADNIGQATRQLVLSAGNHSWTAEFDNCDELIAPFTGLLRGWNQIIPTQIETDEPAFCVSRDEEGYHWNSPIVSEKGKLLAGQSQDPAPVIWDLHYTLISSLSYYRSEQLNLHCAAVRFGDGLVLFPSEGRAGKSTLCVALASKGYRIYGDDVVAISHEDSSAVSLGFLPRIRLPIPVQVAGQDFADFIQRQGGYVSEVGQYVDLDSSLLADFGEKMPVRAVVNLKRTNKKVPAALSSTHTAHGLKSIIGQNLSSFSKASEAFDTLHRLTANASCYELKYSSIDDAIATLSQEFGQSGEL